MSRQPGARGGEVPGGGWLLVTVSTSGTSGSLRVHVWRKLRSLGALYLQSSVCLLPARPVPTREVEQLLDRVHGQGGTARVLAVSIDDPAAEQGLRQELNQARDAEYREVLDRVPAFLDEIDLERRKGRASYTEVEESEADLARFHSWLAKIQARDYFGAPLGEQARAAVARCAHELAAFELEAVAAESPLHEDRPGALDALRSAESDR